VCYCLLQVQQLALLASTLQALVTACCCNTHCDSSSSSSSGNKGAQLATQLTRCLLDTLIELDQQLSGCPSAAAAADKARVADASAIIQQCKHFVTEQQQQQQQQQQRQRGARAPLACDGGRSPKASSMCSSPRAGFSFHHQQQQQQSDLDQLRQLTEKAELEAERLQLKQERAQIHEQVRTGAS
jgi:hypothetical protein